MIAHCSLLPPDPDLAFSLTPIHSVVSPCLQEHQPSLDAYQHRIDQLEKIIQSLETTVNLQQIHLDLLQA